MDYPGFVSLPSQQTLLAGTKQPQTNFVNMGWGRDNFWQIIGPEGKAFCQNVFWIFANVLLQYVQRAGGRALY